MRNGRTAPPASPWLLCLRTLAVVLVLYAHVESAAGLQTRGQPWISIPDYRIYAPDGTDSGFGRFSRMRRWLLGETHRGVIVVLS